MKTIPAQIVFVEKDRGHAWTGRLLLNSAALDAQHNMRPVTGTPRWDITENPETGSCTVLMQGGHVEGRRYRVFPSVTEAQKAGIRWAGRRFRIPV